MRLWKRNWIVFAAIAVHFSWGIILLFSDQPLCTAPLAESPFHGYPRIAAAVYIGAAATAIIPLLWRRIDHGFTALLCIVPQQWLLVMSAFSAIRCVSRGSYADGVHRPWEFILADQLWPIAGAMIHFLALVDWYYYSYPREK